MTRRGRPRPDSRGDGDGWVECAEGHRHWGLFGAAGLLLHRRPPGGEDEVLLQHRAEWSHHGGTWGLLGGARHRAESAVDAALREAAEEGGLSPHDTRVEGEYDDEHRGWSYATVLASATRFDVDARPTGGESIDVVWHRADAVARLPLHPGFAQSWPLLRNAMPGLSVVVDAANVMGSRPDGWWRDRAGAAARIIRSCCLLAERGVADRDLPTVVPRPPLARWWPYPIVVVEGAARPAAKLDGPLAHVVAATADGDDAIVEEVRHQRSRPTLVVTADRGLRARCEALGAAVVGPRWLLGVLDALEQSRPKA